MEPLRLRVGAVALAAALSGCWLDERPREPIYPEWRANTTTPQSYLCGTVSALVVKSGKSGIGVTLVFDGGEATCDVAIDAVTLDVEGRPVARGVPAAPMPHLGPGVRVEMYLPLPFDGEASYAAGERHAVLTIRFGENAARFELELAHRGDR